jgi:hypothetical protein
MALREDPVNSFIGGKHLVDTVTAIQEAFGDVFKELNHQELVEYFGASLNATSQSQLDEISSILRAITRTIQIVLQNLVRLSRGSPKANGSNSVRAKIADFVDDILTAITYHSRRCLEMHSDTVSRKIKIGQEKLLSSLTRLVLEILNSLVVGQDSHFELFEAIVWLIFQRCGHAIYILQSGHDSCDTIEEEIEQDRRAVESGKSTLAMEIAETESRYIFVLMKRIKQLAPYHYNPRTESNGPKHVAHVPKQTTAQLTKDVKDKLQRTLIECIWDEKYDSCADVIQTPVLKPVALTIPKGYSKDDKYSWFLKEMWCMFAWEMLGKDVKK